MFDTRKIKFNHIRAFNKKHKRTVGFFENISEILVEKIFDDKKENKRKSILEIAARNDVLRKKIYSKGLQPIYFQTCLSENILVQNNKRVISSLNDQVFQEKTFHFCFSVLSLNSSNNIPFTFKNIHNLLKTDGIFASIFPSDDCFKEFRSIFIEFFKPDKNYNFNPLFDIQTLGNLCSAAGFNNVIVDKEKFFLNIAKPEEVWQFIRYVGESNYLLERRNFTIKKSLFKKFYNKYANELKKGNLNKNTLSFYYLIGKK